MCGIAGLVCLRDGCREPDHLALVGRICDLQVHRGPDDRGVMQLGRVCLGSNRLSIIDLSAAGHMPMADPDGRVWIVYNGETYNFQTLRHELSQQGYTFASRTDTEVVLAAFRRWGTPSFDRLVGMFAFAVFDRATDTLTLVRDRFGKKPLYYTQIDGHFVFASEIKSLLGVGPAPRPNYQRLIEWSLYRNADFGSADTLIESVSALPAGHYLTVTGRSVGTPRRYYAPEDQVDRDRYAAFRRAPADSVTADIESQLASSVRARLVSDVPLGTLCSGGIDSSLITALCARDLPDVTAFHVSVEGYAALDESRYARQVTGALGIELRTYPLTASAFRELLPRAIHHADVPLTHPNSVAFLAISEFARQHGVVILLSGEAADELFGGYPQRYRRYRQFLRARRWLARLPVKLRRIIGLTGYASEGLPATSFSEYEGLLAHTTAFLDKFARADLRLRCEEAYAFVPNATEQKVLAAMLADMTNFLAPLLRRLDRMSMAASVECRTPFLDHGLVQSVINLPLEYRLRGGTDKWILKKIAARHLPRDVVYRRKVGFPLPVRDYLAPLARPAFFANGFCSDYLGMHPRGLLEAVTSWEQNVHGFFNLLALEIWGRMFFLGESVEGVTDRLLAGTTRDAGRSRSARQPEVERPVSGSAT
jgi:asparagine synthase (glutamine-hydrolysing)